jgi:hypothetical protein
MMFLPRDRRLVLVRLGLVAGLLAGCSSEGVPAADGGTADAPLVLPDAGPLPDMDVYNKKPDAWVGTSCGFDYDTEFVYATAATWEPPVTTFLPWQGQWLAGAGPAQGPDLADPGPDRIAHAEPAPPHVWVGRSTPRQTGAGDITMPAYSDNMPLFERAATWDTATRCYELPDVAVYLTEAEAWALYREIAELTTGESLNDKLEVRTVVGVRGGYPGSFRFHGNKPNRFNDTLVLLWKDAAGNPHVREFPVNTDTGAVYFGYHSSSSLRPNRRYAYINDWHKTYNALHINEIGYPVRDDANGNGHWDSDRNGWLPPPTPEDHDRTGSGHNIHMASVDAPLGTAKVNNWSAGCQTIPGMANWTEFITNAWTNLNDPVSYLLVDVRDIDHRVWAPCTPDGTHACPFEIDVFPYTHSGDTSTSSEKQFKLYNCSDADESGPEVVYFFTVSTSGTLDVAVDTSQPRTVVDPDVHLLDADDPNACLNRSNLSFSQSLGPGRYFIVVDSFVSGGKSLAGPYTVTVDFN